MLQIELKKILFYQKGLMTILLCLLAYTVLVLCRGYDSSYLLDRKEDVYLSYMERWQGGITEEKAQEMKTEYDAVNRSNAGNKEVFMTVYNQYYYAKENTACRYLMDERGWNTLLTHDGLNFILLFCLLALSVPVFCGEYQCGMNQILRSCRNGRNRIARIKLLTIMALAVYVAALFQLIDFLVLSAEAGLDGASYPLQSLRFFERSPYYITIGQAYTIVVLCRCLGAAWFALLTALLSNLFRRVILTAFSGIVVSVMPHLIGSSFIKYILPVPAGLLAGTGYLWGTLSETGYDESWNLTEIVTFRGVEPKELGLLLIAALIIIGGMFYAGIRCYVGKRNLRILHSRTTVAILALLFAVSLSGCARSGKSEITYDFLLDTTQGENTAYSVTLDMVDNKIYAADKQSGETIMLNRNPFPSDKTISSIFVDETACYYCEQGYAGKGFQIYRIDLKDFSERLYFSNTADNTADFWGLNRHSLTEDEILADSGMVSSFMVDGDYIYYLQDKQLWKVCRFTGHETEAISDTGNAESLTYKNGKIVTA